MQIESIKSEAYIQFECFTWHWNAYPDERGLLFAVPNGGFRNLKEAARLKATGTVPGVADMLFVFVGMVFAFEFKTATGRQSTAQKQWQETFEANGGRYFIVKNLLEFQSIVLYLHKIYKPNH